MDKKVGAGAAGLIAALMYGGAQVLDHEARISIVEDACLAGDEPPEPEEPEVASEEPEVASEEPEEG